MGVKFKEHRGACWGLPRWLSGKEPTWQCRRHKRRDFDPWVRKMPWRREWQPTPVFLPGESHGRRSLESYSPWGRKESDTTEQLTLLLHFLFYSLFPLSTVENPLCPINDCVCICVCVYESHAKLRLCCCSVALFCLTLCDPTDCSTPGLPVHHQLLELAQTRVHGVSDALQPSHRLSSPSPPTFNLSQHQGLSH